MQGDFLLQKHILQIFFFVLGKELKRRVFSGFTKKKEDKFFSTDSLGCFFSQLVKLFLNLNRNLFFFKKKLITESLKSCCGKRKDFFMSYYTFSLLSARCFLLILL